MVYARGGPDVMVPLAAGGVAPRALVGAHVSVGAEFFGATLGDGGYVSLFIDLDCALRGGLGGVASPLDVMRASFEPGTGFRLGF